MYIWCGVDGVPDVEEVASLLDLGGDGGGAVAETLGTEADLRPHDVDRVRGALLLGDGRSFAARPTRY